jgi:hypothetical protein
LNSHELGIYIVAEHFDTLFVGFAGGSWLYGVKVRTLSVINEPL